MSTFNGIVEEFPLIRIDHFRKNPDRPPPQACFLSHVHSDHLLGLESLRSPFVYCSLATREILLRIEKYPHRMNFAKGILESRKQEYKHLAKLLRPIPLHVPTEIELTSGNTIRVTLFNANHCPGAVMFLIEGNGKAILYTGDIRAEPWWVESLVRNPVFIPYTLGDHRLDRIYLDTTFATKSDICASFPSKAEGIKELLQKIKAYPEDTIFYFRSWTFGYEDVWLALSAALKTRVHVDYYQLRLYRSLALRSNSEIGVDEASYLCGFTLGNTRVPGCLTSEVDAKSTRIHSCEPGVVCSTISSKPSVYITPIVTRDKNGSDVLELGAGGGMGDLTQSHQLLFPDRSAVDRFVDLCSEYVQEPTTRKAIIDAAVQAFESKSKSLSLNAYGIKEEDEITLEKLLGMLSQGSRRDMLPGRTSITSRLPDSIRFPYSRHSSYDELCGLVEAFRPRDVYPCTVDPETWTEAVSMENLFGHLCSGSVFSHDLEMKDLIGQDEDLPPRKRARRGSNASTAEVSTQRSIIETSFSQEISINHLEEIRYPTLPPNSSSQPGSQIEVEQPRIDVHDTTIDTELTPSSPSQPPLNFSQSQANGFSTSPDVRIQAIKQALKQKALNNELDFDLESSHADSQSQQHFSISQHLLPDLEEEDFEHDQYRKPAPDTDPNLQLISEKSAEEPIDSYPSSNPPSISPSAFASQDTIPILSHDDHDDQNESHRSVSLKRTHSRRMAAYRAVRDESWSFLYSLVSAGNNHSMKEEEL